ncbi:hypothetical protein DFJ74DRAFT_429138 [Hyaloraphidium curvatum]|nr:hypothetical protein DFJ74DRAFT_429138 [Hyaloraphidium curvatum]
MAEDVSSRPPAAEDGADDEAADARASRRASAESDSERPFERASPRTVMSESPVAESFAPAAALRAPSTSSASSLAKTPTKPPTFRIGSPDDSPVAPREAHRTETTSSAGTIMPDAQGGAAAGAPKGEPAGGGAAAQAVARERPSNVAPSTADKAAPQGVRSVEVVSVSPISGSPEDLEEGDLGGASEGERNPDTGDDEDDDDDIEDRDSGADDEGEGGGSDAELEQTIGDEDVDSDDSGSGDRSVPRTFQAKPFKGHAEAEAKAAPAASAAAPKVQGIGYADEKKGPGSDKVATSVSSTSSILSNRSTATGDGKTDRAKPDLKREMSTTKVSFKEPPQNLRRTASLANSADALPPAVGKSAVGQAPAGGPVTEGGPPAGPEKIPAKAAVPAQPTKTTPTSLSSSFKRTEGFFVEPKAAAAKKDGEQPAKGAIVEGKIQMAPVSASPTGALTLKLKQVAKPPDAKPPSRPPSLEAVQSAANPAAKPPVAARTPEPILATASPKAGAQKAPQPVTQEGDSKTLPPVAPAAPPASKSPATQPPEHQRTSALRSSLPPGLPQPPQRAGSPLRTATPEQPRDQAPAPPESGDVSRRPVAAPPKPDTRPFAESPYQPAFTPNVPAALGAGAYRLSPHLSAGGSESVAIVRTISPGLSTAGSVDASPSSYNALFASTSPSTSLSRTQKKLLLQRQAFMASDANYVVNPRNQNRLAKDMERVNREYWVCTRRWADPMQESLDRVMAAVRQERIRAGLPVDGAEGEASAGQRTEPNGEASVAASTAGPPSSAASTSSTPNPPSPITRPPGQTVERMTDRLGSESTTNLQNKRLQNARNSDQGTMRRIQSAPGMAAGTRTRSSGLWNMLFGN